MNTTSFCVGTLALVPGCTKCGQPLIPLVYSSSFELQRVFFFFCPKLLIQSGKLFREGYIKMPGLGKLKHTFSEIIFFPSRARS